MSSRLRYNNCFGSLATSGTDVTNSTTSTTINFAAALTSNGTAVPTISGGNIIPLTLDYGTTNEEIVWLTAYTSGATTGTVTRAQEGTTASTHASGVWAATPTAADWTQGGDVSGTVDAATVTAVNGVATSAVQAAEHNSAAPIYLANTFR